MKALLALLSALAAGPAASPSTASLEAGIAALADFRAEDAIQLLERARYEGPYALADHIRLFEQLGIAYAYVERGPDALAAFDTLLALDPAHAISYTLSPKVTFLFEQARSRTRDRAAPALDLRWPLGLAVGDPIPLDLELVADPKSFMRRARLSHRLRGAPAWSTAEVSLTSPGARIDLPPAAPASVRPEAVEVFVTVYDDHGNEVLRWASEQRPREIALSYEPPDPWYSRWWVWAAAGTVVAAGASVAVFAVTREPGPTVGGILEVKP